MTQELAIGAFGVSLVINVILRMLYNTFSIPNKLKPWIAVTIGILLGIVALFYTLPVDTPVDFKMVVDHVLGGFMTGATAVGMYEMTKKKNGAGTP